jgi:hypothetical protein
MEAGAGRAPLAFVVAVILGKEATFDIARLHQRLTSIIRSAQISWYIAEVSWKPVLNIRLLSQNHIHPFLRCLPNRNTAVSSQSLNHPGKVCTSLSCSQTTMQSLLTEGPKQSVEIQFVENWVEVLPFFHTI